MSTSENLIFPKKIFDPVFYLESKPGKKQAKQDHQRGAGFNFFPDGSEGLHDMISNSGGRKVKMPGNFFMF